MKNKTNTTRFWINLIVITIVLAVFKINGQLHWDWVWVLAPLWIPFAISFLAVIIVLTYIETMEKRNKDEK